MPAARLCSGLVKIVVALPAEYMLYYLARGGAQANPRAEGSTKMAELDMSWVTEYQVVEDTFEKRDMAEFEKFDI